MTKKLTTVILSFLLIACSSISIYGADTNILENTDQTNQDEIVEDAGEEGDVAGDESGSDEEDKDDTVIDDKEDDTDVDSDAEEEEEKKAAEEAKKIAAEKKAAEKYKKGLAAYIRKVNRNVGKTKSLNMAAQFIKKGEKYNIEPELLMAIAQRESTFYTSATSPYGYKGLMQTSDALAINYGYKPSSLYKASVSIDVAARYLRTLKRSFKTTKLAITAYAWGSGNVRNGNYNFKIANDRINLKNKIKKYLKQKNYV